MHIRRRWFVGLALAYLGAGAAHAAGVSKADARALRAVIRAQLAAFAADDAALAYSYAAPAIRQQFGTAQRFMAMVREGYPVVYRPASVTFLEPERAEAGGVLQAAQMTDASGASWLAIYRLQRQPDRAWRITGCDVVRNEGRAT